MKTFEETQQGWGGHEVRDRSWGGALDGVGRTVRLAAIAYVAPAAVGVLLFVGLAYLAFRLTVADDLRSLVLEPTVAPVALGVTSLVLMTGAGFILTGIALCRVMRERHYLLMDREGLVEEVSQEFDKLREFMSRKADCVSLVEGRVSRVAAFAERVEREVRWLDERVCTIETRTSAAAEPPLRGASSDATSVSVNVVPANHSASAPRSHADVRT